MASRLELGELLHSLRMSSDLTLEGLAERSGVSARTLSDIERRVSVAPQRRTVSAIADGLGLDAEERERFLRAARQRRSAIAGGDRASAIAPHRIGDFTGRDAEIQTVASFLRESLSDAGPVPAAIISGTPGVGKTSVGLEALHRMAPHGTPVFFVDLDGFNAVALTPLQILRALLRQVPGIGEHVPTSVEAASELWAAASLEHRPLVLLDNAANESQIRPVLAGRARAVLITSRRTLAGLEGAHRVTLGPLSQADSVLFLHKLIPAHQLDAPGIDELAELCLFVPLALRIAGNRIASRPEWSVRDFIERLRSTEDTLRVLVAGDLAVEAAIALSYDDLDGDAAEIFRSIAVIDGGTFDARMAAAAAATHLLHAEDRLDDLVDLGLLEARGGNRYRMHDHLRVFASSRLRTVSGSEGVAQRRDRLRHWLLSSLERAGAWFEPARSADSWRAGVAVFTDRDAAAAWIRLEGIHWWPAMEAMAAAGHHALVVDVADALHWFSDVWLEWGRWHDFFSLAVDSARALADSRLEAMHLGYVAWTEMVERRDRHAALSTARQALEAADLAGDDAQRGWANFYICWAATDLENYDEAARAGRESIVAFARSGDTDGSIQALIATTRVNALRGDHAAAVAEYTAALASLAHDRSREEETVVLVALSGLNAHLSSSQRALGRPEEALRSANESLRVSRLLDSSQRIASSLQIRAAALAAMGDAVSAEADIDEGLAVLGLTTNDAYLEEQRSLLETLREEISSRRGS